MSSRHAILDMNDFGCASCVYAIERLGRKTAGVVDIRADLGRKEIHIDYDDPRAIEEILAYIRKIGHEATVRSTG